MFQTDILGAKGKPRITVKLPDMSFDDYNPAIFGQMFAVALGNYSEMITVDGNVSETAMETIKTGHVSFLFDEKGNIRT